MQVSLYLLKIDPVILGGPPTSVVSCLCSDSELLALKLHEFAFCLVANPAQCPLTKVFYKPSLIFIG